MIINGGCLCGQVRYEVTEALIDADHCHCSMCRRQHGAAFATYASVHPRSFNWVSGESLIRCFESASADGWCFCINCGSTLAATSSGKIIAITLGTVEGDPGIQPTAHIFVGSKAQWYDLNDDLPQYEERAKDDC